MDILHKKWDTRFVRFTQKTAAPLVAYKRLTIIYLTPIHFCWFFSLFLYQAHTVKCPYMVCSDISREGDVLYYEHYLWARVIDVLTYMRRLKYIWAKLKLALPVRNSGSCYRTRSGVGGGSGSAELYVSRVTSDSMNTFRNGITCKGWSLLAARVISISNTIHPRRCTKAASPSLAFLLMSNLFQYPSTCRLEQSCFCNYSLQHSPATHMPSLHHC